MITDAAEGNNNLATANGYQDDSYINRNEAGNNNPSAIHLINSLVHQKAIARVGNGNNNEDNMDIAIAKQNNTLNNFSSSNPSNTDYENSPIDQEATAEVQGRGNGARNITIADADQNTSFINGNTYTCRRIWQL